MSADSSFSKSLARVMQLLVLSEESLARGHQRNMELLDSSMAELTRLDDCSTAGSDSTLNECVPHVHVHVHVHRLRMYS